jgi:hypothetical protein
VGFGDSGHPVPTDVGSPEHADARARDLSSGGGRNQEPEPRPGCRWTIVAVFVAVAGLIVLIWLVGLILG